MKMTLNEVRVRLSNLTSVSERNRKPVSEKRLPAKLSISIGKNIINLESELKLLENERKKLVETYAKKDENGKAVIENNEYKMDDMDSFKAEFEELLKEEIDVDIRTVPMSIIENYDDSKYDVLTPEDIVVIDFMIVEDGGLKHE